MNEPKRITLDSEAYHTLCDALDLYARHYRVDEIYPEDEEHNEDLANTVYRTRNQLAQFLEFFVVKKVPAGTYLDTNMDVRDIPNKEDQ